MDASEILFALNVSIIALEIVVIGTLIYTAVKIRSRIKEFIRRQDEFVGVWSRIDKVATENARILEQRIVERTDDLNNRLNYLTRWQKITAKMIRQYMPHIKE